MNLSQRIKDEAIAIGFDKVGIARVGRLTDESDHLNEWLARGYHGTMGWMQKNAQKRVNPELVLPDAKSIVSVALNYYVDAEHDRSAGTGKISRYAWGDDYHVILQERLETLLKFVKDSCPGVRGKAYVDTGPVMDKVWAQRSGIGWLGKHTNVISQELGSWIFLGEIILDIKLDPDLPATDHCGSCTLCIEACPTDAITEPYVVDSNRCISYVTIEHRGEIAPELGAKFDNWLYGCDICQDVCPWNRKFSTETVVAEFEPREFNKVPILAEVAAMTQEEFSRKFSRSPIKRTKVEGLKRNAKMLLSNIAAKSPGDEGKE